MAPALAKPAPEAIATRIVEHYRRHRRDLPWRRTRDPYAIWVSEIMLQQTRVAAAAPYYERWMSRFPSVEALAAAELDDVLAAWTGLGYYRRARNLHRGAREVVARYGSALPADAAELRRLPGIGHYTAGAIASIAFERPEPVVDGNVARVLARLYAVDRDIKARATQKTLWALAADLVPSDAPGDFNQGLMELGATLCSPRAPSCRACPVAKLCLARRAGREHELPVAAPRQADADKELLALDALWLVRRQRLLVARREPAGLYGGLWELPQTPDRDQLATLVGLDLDLSAEPACERRQVLSHRRLQIRVWTARARGRARLAAESGYDRLCWQPLETLDELGISTATRSIIAKMKRSASWQAKDKKQSASSRKATRKSSRVSTP